MSNTFRQELRTFEHCNCTRPLATITVAKWLLTASWGQHGYLAQIVQTATRETNLTKRHSATVGILLFAVTGVAVSAETDLTGKWVGQFNGVQIAVPLQPSGFGYLSGEPTRTKGPPKFVEATLQIEIETQKKDLAVGTWRAGEFKQQFVCAQTGHTLWNCVDAGGRATLEVTSGSEIKVCYFDNREGAQGAGCAILQRTHS